MSQEWAALLVGAWTLGFVGSGHCIGMCGGIAGALGMTDASSRPRAALFASIQHSIGRVASYSLLGAAVGLIGQSTSVWLGVGPSIRIAAGLLIVAVGLRLAGLSLGLDRLEQAGLGVWRRLRPLITRIGPPDRPWKRLALGALWGWLPCGLVYSALASSAATGDAASGALFMLCFGLGTIPALVLAGSAAGGMGALLRRLSTRRVAGAMLVVFGLWSVAIGLSAHSGHSGHSTHSAQGEGVDAGHAPHSDHGAHPGPGAGTHGPPQQGGASDPI